MPLLSLDPWLAERFGYDVFRVAPTSDAAASISAHRVSVPRAFYYTKIPITAIVDFAAFTAAGFSVVETHLMFRADPKHVFAQEIRVADIKIGAFPNLHEEAVAIAGACFRYSRFHLDPFVPDAIAHAIKREWVRSYANGTRGDRFFIAARAGRAVGFLAAMQGDVDGEQCAIIDLMGVHPNAQGAGVGSALIRTFAGAYHGQVTALHVGTQAANIPSVRCYERMGFRFADAAYVLHLHHQHAAVPAAVHG